jgi:hypothetical protein
MKMPLDTFTGSQGKGQFMTVEHQKPQQTERGQATGLRYRRRFGATSPPRQNQRGSQWASN